MPVVSLVKTSVLVIVYVASLLVICPMASGEQPGYTLEDFKVPIDLPFNETRSSITNYAWGAEITCDYDTPFVYLVEPRNNIQSQIVISRSSDYNANARWFKERRTTIQTYVDDIKRRESSTSIKPTDSLFELSDTPNRTTYVFKRTVDTSRPTVLASGYGGVTILVNDKGYCYISWFVADYDLAAAQAMLKAIEDRCNELWEGKTQLSMTHYNAFDPEILDNTARGDKDIAVFNEHNGGDVSVTLQDDSGKPIAGRDVYFFLLGVPENNNAIVLPDQGEELAAILRDSIPQVKDPGLFDSWHRYVKVATNEHGVATMNYVREGYVDYDALEKAIHENGRIIYTVYAYTFKEDPFSAKGQGRKAQIQSEGSAAIDYKSVAVVRNLYYMSKDPGLDKGIFIERSEATGGPAEDVSVDEVPVNIMPGDVVMLEKDTCAVVDWVSGERFFIKPKGDYFDEGSKYARVQIGNKDLGLYYRVKFSNAVWATKMAFEAGHWGHSFVMMYVESSGWPIAHAVSITVAIIGAEHGIESSEDLEVQRNAPETMVVPHSRILIDCGGNGSIYTFEGTASVYDKNGTFIANVTTGNKMMEAGNGTFSPVSGFSQDKVDADQKRLLTHVNTLEAITVGQDPTNTPMSSSPKSPAPGLMAGALAIVAVVCLLRKSRGP